MHSRPSRVGSRESLAYSKSGPKPGGASCLSAKTAQCLIGLPLVLALFALSLQVRPLHRCCSQHLTLAVVNGCKPLNKRYSNTCGSPAHVVYVAAVDHTRSIEPETAAFNDRRLCYQVRSGTALVNHVPIACTLLRSVHLTKVLVAAVTGHSTCNYL